jgi:hypothetical protein
MMKPVLSVVLSAVVLAAIAVSPVSQAAPVGPARPIPSASAQTRNSAVVYYKPSANGSDTTIYANDKARATLKCVTSTRATFSLVVQGVKAYCKLTGSTMLKAPLLCPGAGAELVTDDKLPPAVQNGQSDRCLKANAPVGVPSSYFAPVCGTNATGGGFGLVVRPGADTCEKRLVSVTLQSPGAAEGVGLLFLSTLVQKPDAPPAEPQPLQPQIDAKSVTCPSGSTLEVDGNAVVCKRG